MIFVLWFSWIMAGGCRDAMDHPPALESVPSVKWLRGPPREAFRRVLKQYRSADFYQDRGELVATGPDREVRAPMRLMVTPRRMIVTAYEAVAVIEGDRLWGQVRGKNWDEFPQRLELRLAEIDSIEPVVDAKFSPSETETLLAADAELSTALGAGAGGPPPQLDWLLASRPLDGLFDQRHRFEWGVPMTIDGHRCRYLSVETDEGFYEFAIDEASGLIRRVHLPPVPTINERIPPDDLRPKPSRGAKRS